MPVILSMVGVFLHAWFLKHVFTQSINQSIKFNVRFIVWRRFRGRPQWPQPIHTHHPCDENTDPLREMPVPVPKSNKSVLKEREKLWWKEMSLKPRQKG